LVSITNRVHVRDPPLEAAGSWGHNALPWVAHVAVAEAVHWFAFPFAVTVSELTVELL
jgi:hypothetical protein